ncbi:hypothetical protein [Aquisphaera insulae]|uniref:hypothetical protein n=1 Tax=Aquisphaera insulae TaxID=2712864 RepID=UPI0013EBCE66|nr:hypothetical protein [Aquisphaera insulae]
MEHGRLRFVAILGMILMMTSCTRGTPSTELTFVGSVAGIEITNPEGPFRRWTVTLSVDRVVSGVSPDAVFRLPQVHSPSQEGLTMGRHFTVHVRKQGHLYEVLSLAPL